MHVRWQAPDPYEVVFTTRQGGVSEGPYASLNLGARTADDEANVFENRRRAYGVAGADPERGAMALQVHGSRVVRAEPAGIVAHAARPSCDGLWTEEAGVGLMLLTADCLPIALVRLDGRRPRLGVVHAGWRGLLEGIAAAGVAAVGGKVAAVVGPGIGPCCYEVRGDVAEPFRAAFGADVVRNGHLDLWSATQRALERAGCVQVERTDLCTACHADLFFSHRRDGGVTGRQGVVAHVA